MQDFLYYIGGPSDLTKQAFYREKVGSYIEVPELSPVEPIARANAKNEDVRVKIHTYHITQMGPNLYVAISDKLF